MAAPEACHDEQMSDYGPLREEARPWWRRMAEQLEAEERDRREWIGDVKRRLGLVTIDDNPAGPGWHALPGDSAFRMTNDRPARPDWPEWKLVAGPGFAMASRDGVNFSVKPDGMPLAEWWASLP